VMAYRPPRYYLGAWISGILWLALLGGTAASWLRTWHRPTRLLPAAIV
jgi:hypothetical protein